MQFSPVRFGLLVGAAFLISITTIDPDLWGHLLIGRDIVRTHAIPSVDPYSFTSDRPWMHHEWLSEVLFFLAFDTAGSLGLVALKTVVVVSTFLLMLISLPRTASQHAGDVLAFLGLVAMFWRFVTIRPQIFSLLLFCAMLSLLVAADHGARKWLIAIPPMAAFWANLHGGYIVGLACLGVWIAVRLAEAKNGRQRASLLTLGLASVAATLVNPAGYGLWRFLWDTVGLSRQDVNDWQPILRFDLVVIAPFAVMALVAVAAALRARKRIDVAYAAISLALAIGTLRVNRLDAFFAISVILLLAPYLASGRQRVGLRAPRNVLGTRTAGAAAVAVFVAGILITGTSVAASGARCMEVVLAPEAEAVAFFKMNHLRGRTLTFFRWGQYAMWHLAPAIQVSMDGRRETVYSESLFDAHMSLYRNERGATSLLQRLTPDFIWLPKDLDVIVTLHKEGWRSIYEGHVSTVLAPNDDRAYVQPEPRARNRCFPSP